jgi:hypothetical protein
MPALRCGYSLEKAPAAVRRSGARTRRVSSMPVTSKHKVVRHSPTKTTGIYFSQNARGFKTFECRYVNSEGKRVYEAVGTFEAAKARLADLTNKVNRARSSPIRPPP